MALRSLLASVALGFLLGACDASDQTAAPASTVTPKTAETVAGAAAQGTAPALVSGLDTPGFNTTVRPQDDLYEFVNGGWLAKTEIPADKARYGSFFLLADQSEEDLRVLIDELGARTNVAPGSAAQKIRDFYNSYMDEAAANDLGIEAIRADLDLIAAATSLTDIYRLFGVLGPDGVTNPLGTFIFSDFEDANTSVVYLTENGITLPDRDYYLKDDERFVEGRKLLSDYATALFRLAGRDDPENFAARLLALETRLAEAHWTKEDNRDRVKQYNPHTLDQLQELAPDIQWSAFLEANQLIGRKRYVVMQPSYYQAVNDIITSTDIQTWKDYLSYHLITAYAPVMGDAYFTASFEFFRKGLQGVEEPRPRWKRALTAIDQTMGELLGQLYVEKYFSTEAKARMQAMIDHLVEAYRQSITELDWMSEETKQQALKKLSKFNSKIGYPDQWRDYGPLDIVPGGLVGNLKRATAFEYQRNLNKLDQPVDKSEWLMTPQTVNAYYLPMWNEIVFPASILHPPFFNLAADDAVNYGAIGAVIGHEIGHGFDDQGRRFDGDGNLRDWWSEEDNKRFLERKDKLAAQYDAYEVIDGMTVNGQFTSGENIGDLGGLSIAYKAYRMSLKGTEPPVIDGWTGAQRFFLGWAQVWREKRRPEEEKRLMTIDSHSPTRFRANGAAVNVPEFYMAFDVMPGDGMYLAPGDRVKIW